MAKDKRNFYLDSFTLVPFLGSQFLERRWRHENDKRHQVGFFEDLERLRVQIEDAKLAGRNDRPDGVERRSVVRLFILSVLDKPPVDNVRLKLRPRDKVVVLTVDLGILFRPASV